MDILTLLILLIIGHAVGDYVLQSGAMSSAKSRHSRYHQERGEDFPAWYYWLTAHALTHAGIVYIITGSTLFLFLELINHWLVDYCKCENKISLNQDQMLHISFKVLYCVLIFMNIQ